MKYIAKDENGQTYDVVLEGDYIISYSKNLFDTTDKIDRPADRTNVYLQIPESLPLRFSIWKLYD